MERYENAVWQNGTVITAASLNRIEENLRDVISCVINMGSEVSSNELTVGDSNANVTSSNGNLTATNKIQAGKLQVGTLQTETEIGNGSALIAGNIEIKGTTTTNKIQAEKLQIGVPETETEISDGSALITGNIIINGTTTIATPSAINHAATKGYVDGKAINALEGITATGTLGGDNGIRISLSAATTNTLGGIKVGTNLNIDNQGVLSATDTTYALADGTTAGLMSAANYTKLDGIPADATSNKGTITGIKIDENTTIGSSSITENGIIDISGHVLTEHQDITGKADTDDPRFTGIASFGNNIQIDSGYNTITIGSAVLSEPQLNSLYSILPQDDIPDGDYTLKLSKSTVDNEPVFSYTWELVNNTSGGE